MTLKGRKDTWTSTQLTQNDTKSTQKHATYHQLDSELPCVMYLSITGTVMVHGR